MGRKTKYNGKDTCLLAQQYAREGLNDEQIAKKLGISLSSFYDYQYKYSDFLQAIKKGKKPVNIQVENAFLKRCLGFSYDEITREKKSNEIIHKKIVTKYVYPDVEAGKFWMINRMKDRWSKNPNPFEEDKNQPINIIFVKDNGNKT